MKPTPVPPDPELPIGRRLEPAEREDLQRRLLELLDDLDTLDVERAEFARDLKERRALTLNELGAVRLILRRGRILRD